MINSARSLKPL